MNCVNFPVVVPPSSFIPSLPSLTQTEGGQVKLKPEDMAMLTKPKAESPVKLEHLGPAGMGKAMTSVRVSHCAEVTC